MIEPDADNAEYRQKLKAAMEQQWLSRSVVRPHKPETWIDGFQRTQGGYMLPGLEMKNDNSS